MGNLRRMSGAIWASAKVVVPFVVGMLALVLVIAWLSGAFREKIEPQLVDRPVRRLTSEPTEVVHEITKSYIEEAVGTLRAASRTVVSAKILATIQEVRVAAGDQVQQGDVLIRLDDQALQAKQKQSEQSRIAAVANLQQAQAQYERVERLVREKAVAQADVDEATRRLQVAKADLSRAEQAVNEAQVMLSYCTITAPKSGRIVDRLAEPGDTAQPGVPLLVLYDAGSLRLEAPVMEDLAVTLKPGDPLQVYVDALQRDVEARVDEIVPQADAPSRSFLVKASLPRSDDLYEGMFGRLRIPAGERKHLCLSTDAIHRIGQLEFVEVVSADGRLERRFIKTGRLGMPGRIEVLSGLQSGERVVLRATSNAT